MLSLTVSLFQATPESHPGINPPSGGLGPDRIISTVNSITTAPYASRVVTVFCRMPGASGIYFEFSFDLGSNQSQQIFIPTLPPGVSADLWIGPWWQGVYTGPGRFQQFFTDHPPGAGHHTVIITG